MKFGIVLAAFLCIAMCQSLVANAVPMPIVDIDDDAKLVDSVLARLSKEGNSNPTVEIISNVRVIIHKNSDHDVEIV